MRAYLPVVLFLLAPLLASAQPVIQSSASMPGPGFALPVKVGTPTGSVGGSGGDQTWDFRAVSLIDVGTLRVVAPSATPYSSSYPSANYAFEIAPIFGAKQYFYFITSADKFETLATGITTGPGSGTDYSPNPLTTLKFPFQFEESLSDTYQEVGGTTETVTVTYDAYGTLLMPYGTYANVVRQKLTYSDGSDYVWYSADPLTPLLAYSYSSNLFQAFAATVSAVEDPAVDVAARLVLLDPASEVATVTIAGSDLAGRPAFLLINTAGETVMRVSLESTITPIALDGIARGIYFYRIDNGPKVLATGTLPVR